MNLVIAMAANYGVPHVRNFVRSFRRHQNNAILLMLQNNDRETRDWLRAEGVLTIDVNMPIHPEFMRFFAMNELVRQYPEYTRIFHCDVRDAVAQGDIFAQLPQPGLHVFREDPSHSIGQSPINNTWIERAYGAEAVARYSGNTVICSGTTLGDRESFRIYTDAMVEEYNALVDRDGPQHVVYNVRDQAVHMHLVYSGALERALAVAGRPLHCHENGIGVFTLAKAKEFSVSKKLRVVPPDKHLPAVVHQYDRHEFLRKGFDAMYAED